jgi:hypothetical protein
MDPVFADFLHDGLGKFIDVADAIAACCKLRLYPVLT